MKKILLVLLTIGAGGVSAQTLIPRVGFVLANSNYDPLDYSESVSNEAKSGFAVGIAYQITLSEKFSLQPELDFVQRNFRHTDTYYGDGYEFKDKSNYTLNYLELPVLVKFTFGGDTKFYVNVGPSVGMGLSGKYDTKGYFGEIVNYESKGDVKFGDRPTNYDGNDVYADKKIDIGMQVGGGVVWKGKIMIDVRYGLGFTDIVSDVDSRNRALQLSVGVPLNLF